MDARTMEVIAGLKQERARLIAQRDRRDETIRLLRCDKQTMRQIIERLSERVNAQHELLSRRAERPACPTCEGRRIKTIHLASIGETIDIDCPDCARRVAKKADLALTPLTR